MRKSLYTLLSASCLVALIAFGCKKKETVEVDNETQSAVDNAVADQEYASIVPTVNNHAINTKGTGASGRLSGVVAAPCDTLKWINRSTADTNLVGGKYVNPPVYELNLLNACSNSFLDGKVRAGKWVIVITAPLRNIGAQMLISLQNHVASGISYSCDTIKVTTTNTTAVSSTYNIKITNGVCQSSSWTIKYNSDRTITHYAKGSPAGTDPVTMVYGTANGVNRQGRAFTVDIPSTSPLVKHKACQFIDKGVLNLTPDGFKTRSVDFGNGVCDDDATFTVNGNTVAFKLK